ncbi:AI-2E family transporter [Myxococcaceae bacterium GXIMD 01537]
MTARTAFTVCFAVLAVAALALFLLRTQVSLTLTGLAALIALALQHLVVRLRRLGLRRGAAIALVVLGLVVAMAVVALLVVPVAMSQGEGLLAELPRLEEQARTTRVFRILRDRLHVLGRGDEAREAREALAAEGMSLSSLLHAIGGAFSVAGGAISVFFLVVFMLMFGEGLLRRLLEQTLPERRGRYARVMHQVYEATGGYLAGLTFICSVNATLATTFLAILGLPFFLPLGLLSGFSSMVPYAGPVVAGSIITLLTWVTGGIWKAVAVATYFVVYGTLEGNVLAPLVFRRTVHLNPLLTLLAVLFCAELAGVVGAVVAVPVVATGQIILGELLSLRRERQRPA